jgi:hypothetical protein
MAEVEELLREGKRLGLQLRGLPRLISMMAQARSFNVRAWRALKKGALPILPCMCLWSHPLAQLLLVLPCQERRNTQQDISIR